MDTKENGNVLFLILIAVALFAALSYAITQSGRGGGDTSNDKLKLDVSRFLQQSVMVKTEILRRNIFGKTIQFDNTSGGIYEPGEGIALEFPPGSLSYSQAATILRRFGWGRVVSSRLIAGGVDIGTSADDEYLLVAYLSDDACAEINDALLGNDAVPSAVIGALGSANYTTPLQYSNFTGFGVFSFAGDIDVLNVPGCSNYQGIYNIYVDVISEN